MATNSLPAPIEPIITTASNDGPMLTPHEGAGEAAPRERVMQPEEPGLEEQEELGQDSDTDSEREIYTYSTVRTNHLDAPLVEKRSKKPPIVKNAEERPKLPTPAGTLTSSTEGYTKMKSPKGKKNNYGSTVHGQSYHLPPPPLLGSDDEGPPPLHRGIPRNYEEPVRSQNPQNNVEPVRSQNPQNDEEPPQTVVPKKDKVFIVNMKRFILSSLGLPDREIPEHVRNICSMIGIPFYLILFGGGIALTTVSLIQGARVNDPDSEEGERDPDLYHMYILTTAAGIFFILLWLFWALTFWWSRISQKTSKYVSFSVIVTLWFILYFISVAVASSLTTLVVEHSDSIFCGEVRNETNTNTKICVESDYKIVPFVGLGAILVLWTVHVCVFLVNVCSSACGKNSQTT